MNVASEALADVRGWLCDNLSEGDAGKVCGMLSVVSRYITELEDENARLDRRRRSLHADVERLSGIIHRQRKELSTMQYAIECRNDENAKLQDENAELRKLVRDMCHLLPYADWLSTECDDMASACIDQAIELGIEAIK